MAGGTETKKSNFWKVIDSRLGISRLAYRVPEHANALPYMLGGMVLGCFAILAATGIFIAQFYNPSLDGAYQSIVYMVTKVPFGGFLRSLHYWAANFFILILLFHLMRVFISGSYKKPRELTWLTGLALFALALGFFFTGSVLKQDQEAMEALTHNIGVGELMGGIGTWFTSGFALSVSIVARVFFAHITILVFFFLAILAFHLYLIKLHGISPKPTIDAVSRPTEGEGESHFTTHLKKLFGYSLLLFAALGALAIVSPAPLGTPGVLGVELAKPPWPFLPFYGMEDLFGFKAVIIGPAILFLLLALIPFLDRNPYLSWRRRKPIMVFGAVIFLTLVGFGLEGYFHKIEAPKMGGLSPQHASYSFFTPIAPVAYAHMIPMITADQSNLSPGDKFAVHADGMPVAGTYMITLESETDSVALGSAEIPQGNDSFDADLVIPKSAPPGSYTVKALHENDRRAFYSIAKFEIVSPNMAPQTMAEPSGGMVSLPNTYTPSELAVIAIVLGLAALGGIALVRGT